MRKIGAVSSEIGHADISGNMKNSESVSKVNRVLLVEDFSNSSMWPKKCLNFRVLDYQLW